MPSSTRPESSSSAWPSAIRLLTDWLGDPVRVDRLLERLAVACSGPERIRCQYLLYGAIRHRGRLEAHWQPWLARSPRRRVQAVLLLAGYELLAATDAGQAAQVAHHAVEQAKAATSLVEARLVNAILRRLLPALAAEPTPGPDAGADVLARYFSHPEWLVARWNAHFGREATRALLAWNQAIPSVYARWRTAGAVPEWLQPTEWTGFFKLDKAPWPEVERALQAGHLYLQDPATRWAVELLAPQPGEAVLDACAAPGGKSLLVADAMGQGQIVALDRPGARLRRLQENLARAGRVQTTLVAGEVAPDVTRTLAEQGAPTAYSAVLLDVPCSNTGVMRHRVDVKWRLQAEDFARHAQQQRSLLATAATLVRPGGRLVYSTCSLDPEENEGVVTAFLEAHASDFFLEQQRLAYPWREGHDGVGAFLLRRAAP